MLKDIRWLEKEFALGDSFEYSWRFYDYEQFSVMMSEFRQTFLLSICAVLTVILVVTSNLAVTFLVALSIIITNLFLTALIFYWGLTLNPIVIINLILAIGTSVDFSAHIAYGYLVEEIPETKKKELKTKSQIRVYKAT